jgi:peptidoglycan/LPS O-acetylase OafA/YrhL
LALVAWGLFVGSNIALLGIPWLMGVLIFYLPKFPARRPWTRGLAIAAALAAVGGGLIVGKMWHSIIADLLLGLVVTLLIWITLHCATAKLPSTYVRAAQRSARSSYTLYLVHVPLLMFLKALLSLPRALPGWHVCLVSLGLLAIILVYAQLVYEVFEKNTDRVRNWIKPYAMGRRAA